MAHSGARVRGRATAPKLAKSSWRLAVRNAPLAFWRDQAYDLAAGLTFHSVISFFPGLLAVVSLLGLVGQSDAATDAMLSALREVSPEVATQELGEVLDSIASSTGSGLAFGLGLGVALWSASRYLAAFARAMNRIYDVEEGRPVWLLLPQLVLLTLALVLLVCLLLLGLIVSGPIARLVGQLLGVGEAGLGLFNILKWPTMLIVVVLIVALLYYVTPNVTPVRFRWISLGALLAIGIWVLLSALFGLYVVNFSRYNITYGALGGIVVFLLWLWITNLTLLFGAEVDAEVERARQLQEGIEAEVNIQLPVRDDRRTAKTDARHEHTVTRSRELRESFDDEDPATPREHDA